MSIYSVMVPFKIAKKKNRRFSHCFLLELRSLYIFFLLESLFVFLFSYLYDLSFYCLILHHFTPIFLPFLSFFSLICFFKKYIRKIRDKKWVYGFPTFFSFYGELEHSYCCLNILDDYSSDIKV